MSIVILLILCSISLGVAFLIAFVWWAKSGQANDLETPAYRILFDDKKNNEN
jgi:cbb3-type cytochrome oxidase maturation protein